MVLVSLCGVSDLIKIMLDYLGGVWIFRYDAIDAII
jgi:hypothetical protein